MRKAWCPECRRFQEVEGLMYDFLRLKCGHAVKRFWDWDVTC